MTEQERAWEAWNEQFVNSEAYNSTKEGRKAAFLAGWKRERAKAKPLVINDSVPRDNCVDEGINDWVRENGLPAGAMIRITVEEL